MTPEEAFLQDILAHPKDDTPRLIFADYLDEHGESERAELIRAQIALYRLAEELMSTEDCNDGRCPGCQERRALEKRIEAVWYLPSAGAGSIPNGWMATLSSVSDPSYCDTKPSLLSFQRGFAAEARCSTDVWRRDGPALVRQHPLQMVRLSDRPPSQNAHLIWGLPADMWNVYRRLGFRGLHFSDEDAFTALSQTCLVWAKEQSNG